MHSIFGFLGFNLYPLLVYFSVSMVWQLWRRTKVCLYALLFDTKLSPNHHEISKKQGDECSLVFLGWLHDCSGIKFLIGLLPLTLTRDFLRRQSSVDCSLHWHFLPPTGFIIPSELRSAISSYSNALSVNACQGDIILLEVRCPGTFILLLSCTNK